VFVWAAIMVAQPLVPGVIGALHLALGIAAARLGTKVQQCAARGARIMHGVDPQGADKRRIASISILLATAALAACVSQGSYYQEVQKADSYEQKAST